MNLAADIAGPAVAWTVWNVAVATAAAGLPASGRPPRARTSRPAPGRGAGPLAVRRWKHLLPDAGWLLPGAVGKRHLPGRDRGSLERYAATLRRGELAHWLSVGFVPLLGRWWPAVVVIPMVVVGVILNLPCIVVLRYNRDRIDRLLARRPDAGISGLNVRSVTHRSS